MSSGAILTSWGTGASLVLVAYCSIDGVIIKIPFGVDVLYICQPCTPSFRIGLGKIESELLDQLRLTRDEHWW